MRRSVVCFAALLASLSCCAQDPPGKSASVHHPVTFSLFDRTRVDTWQWFAAPPYSATYGYVQSLLRIGIAQKLDRWDWQLELAQPAILDAPTDAVSPVAAQGQLGLGGTYYAANGNNDYPAAAFLKQGFVRYRFSGAGRNVRLGRFEFFDGQETRPTNATIAWLQSHRIAQRLIGNFGFSNAQRSFDGLDASYRFGSSTLTAMASRADQGVFNMNGNPEFNVDVQYLAFTHSAAHGHVLARAFGIGYHDGRTGIAKTDNRALPVRQADRHNIRLGTYGGDVLASIPAGPGSFDLVFWGALQNGNWGVQSDSAGAAAVEGGYRLTSLKTSPWVRAGWFRSTGDNNPTDNRHNTFFQILPTPRIYARTPFYNLMNSTDEFVQVVDQPSRRLNLEADVHGLQLTSSKDLWYLGGGAFDNSVFGFVGRPASGHTSFATLVDGSADWQTTHNVALNFYYGYAQGKGAPTAIYPTGHSLQYGYVEMVYHWGD
ncbi:MAG: alginate export family protein [Acidobacteriota bacterium]